MNLLIDPKSQLISFKNSNFSILPSDQKIEEEAHDSVSKGRYYPVQIGEVIQQKYQILGKLGFGLGSTVWLANEYWYVSLIRARRGLSRSRANLANTAQHEKYCRPEDLHQRCSESS